MKKTFLVGVCLAIIILPQIVNGANQKQLIANVPFTSQAPFGNWSDQRQQNGCEEASALMAIHWAQGKNLTKQEALTEITKLADWLIKKHGQAVDTSAQDTIDWIFKDYFEYDQVSLMEKATNQKIIQALRQGQLVIAPMNGQKLHNPNFKQPGPERHMLVIRGYDPVSQKFITNDPGTKRGENYQYPAKVVEQAIRDYPTGNHLAITTTTKNVIIISKKSIKKPPQLDKSANFEYSKEAND